MGKENKVDTALKFSQYASIFGLTKNLILIFLIICLISVGIFYVALKNWYSSFSLVAYSMIMPSIIFISLWKILFRKYLTSHSLSLCILCSLIIALFFGTALILNYKIQEALSYALPVIFISTLTASYLLTGSKSNSLISAIMITAFIGFSTLSYMKMTYKEIINQTLLSSIFVLAVSFISLKLIDAPFKKRYGISSITVVSSFLSDWYYGKGKIEELLDKIGQKIDMEICALKIEISGKSKNLIYCIIPYFHFGPFGNLGSSRFPAIAKKYLKNVLVFHGTTTHDFNLINNKQNLYVIKAVENAKYKNIEKIFFDKSFYGDAEADLLCFDNNALVFLTRAPKLTEDISYTAGLLLMEKLNKNFERSYVIDRHDSPVSKITHFSLFSEEYKDYTNAALMLKKGKGKKPYIGFSHCTLDSNAADEAGFSILVIKANKDIALISIDANGISLNTRNFIIYTCNKYGLEPIICTTDSHGKNAVKNIINEYRITENDKLNIEKAIKEAKEEADKRNKTKIYVASIPLKLKVIGETNIEEFIATINATWSILKFMIPLSLFITIIGLFFIISP